LCLKKFLQEIRSEFKDVALLLSKEDGRAPSLIHTLKGLSGNLRANLLYEICKNIDTKYKKGQKITKGDMEQLNVALQSTIERIQEILLNKQSDALFEKLPYEETKKLFYDIKQRISKSNMIESKKINSLLKNLSTLVNASELTKWEKEIEAFEYDKALEIMSRWKF